ncbi:aminotransferase class IV [Puia dinghuensis]|uniref:branched-chain-amino-acid transaminase n=1 Tax=Puia dinghuensis TaxID=1792502 RepID=A0A8J2UIU1_9BACT|nr:aminotransferase class IV [Puia dinghuensis]GGB22663.1 aminodeoxychorismate lyase [Puia dinghuensis]
MNTSTAWINHNGAFLHAGSPVLTAGNRGFRYGDGLFETLLVKNGRIRLRDYHFDRLFAGMRLLRFAIPPSFTPENLESQILELCQRNAHSPLARVRFVVFRGEGGLYDTENLQPHYLIETWPLTPDDIGLNDKGLVIDVYPGGMKSCDAIANVKSNNFLLYVLAALYAREHWLDDCLVFNCYERLADSTIANLFYIKNRQVYTPSLSEGGVAGVMRRFLLAALPAAGFPVHERPVSVNDLLAADEVFLTNAIKGIRWVSSFRQSQYTGAISRTIYDQLINGLS